MALDEEQGDDQPANTSIAVEERMYRFELIMRERYCHQRRQIGFVQELLPCRKSRFHFIRRWGDIGSRFGRAARLADPVLGFSKFPARRMMSANAGHQLFMKLFDEAHADGQFLEPRYAVLQGDYVVTNLPQIIGASFDDCSSFGRQEFAQSRVCAFDPARQHGFTPGEWTQENMRVRQSRGFSREIPDEAIRVGQQSHQPGFPFEFRR